MSRNGVYGYCNLQNSAVDSPVGPLVRLSSGALGFGGGVAEGEDEGLVVEDGHFLAHGLRE